MLKNNDRITVQTPSGCVTIGGLDSIRLKRTPHPYPLEHPPSGTERTGSPWGEKGDGWCMSEYLFLRHHFLRSGYSVPPRQERPKNHGNERIVQMTEKVI